MLNFILTLNVQIWCNFVTLEKTPVFPKLGADQFTKKWIIMWYCVYSNFYKYHFFSRYHLRLTAVVVSCVWLMKSNSPKFRSELHILAVLEMSVFSNWWIYWNKFVQQSVSKMVWWDSAVLWKRMNGHLFLGISTAPM